MIRESTLNAAIERGILSAEQARALRALAAETAPAPEEPQDDEKLRFITGFGDIFVTLGLGLFTSAINYFAFAAAGPAGRWAALAVAAWLLAEFFTRIRRMALPSIALLGLFAVSVFGTANHLLGIATATSRETFGMSGWFGMNPDEPGLITAAALATAVMVGVHYLRFRVPITVATGAAALVAAFLAGLFALAPSFARSWLPVLILLMGLGVFALAMRFDLSDPRRETRRTDIAFWLHLLAAPLIVHPLIAQMTPAIGLQTSAAVGVIAIFLALGLVAVVIDRRAMLVSGLSYAGYAFAALINQAGLSGSGTPLTLLALGSFVLLLSAGWRPMRATLLRLLPSSFSRRLPQPLASS